MSKWVPGDNHAQGVACSCSSARQRVSRPAYSASAAGAHETACQLADRQTASGAGAGAVQQSEQEREAERFHHLHRAGSQLLLGTGTSGDRRSRRLRGVLCKLTSCTHLSQVSVRCVLATKQFLGCCGNHPLLWVGLSPFLDANFPCLLASWSVQCMAGIRRPYSQYVNLGVDTHLGT